MKYLDEHRDATLAKKLMQEIERCRTQPWRIMEVCGGQTHAIVKHGIDYLLPQGIELVHGPGSPVCVTPLEMLDRAHAIAARPEVIFCSFGDMLRVSGFRIAQANPDRQVVFFAIGFETTAPANAMTVHQAHQLGIENFCLLVSHVRVPPAIGSILQSPQNRVQGFLGPGHVCTIMGYQEYETISAEYNVPIVITGFEPVDILEGVFRVVRQLEAGRAAMENQYSRVVNRAGNLAAQQIIQRVFEVCDQKWRGMGTIAESGYKLTPEFNDYDAGRIFAVEGINPEEPAICISGQILRGLKKPYECAAFAKECTPHRPLGATMVSAEGACAAYYSYGRHLSIEPVGSQPEPR